MVGRDDGKGLPVCLTAHGRLEGLHMTEVCLHSVHIPY